MIRASNLTLRRGTKVLLNQADFVVHPGERVGIVGKNGAGKSTLFALLAGEIDADGGSLSIPTGWRIASVAQEIIDLDRPAREFVIDGDTHLRTLQAERAALNDATTTARLGTRIAELESALADAGAWTAAARAEQLLSGLGFAPDEWELPVRQFSGGWRMRLNLARALMAPSDLLLLDEPTNHLDLDAMLWLERWLSSYPGTVLLISHDTEFLDSVARSILHFDNGKLVRYKGGYEEFVSQRAERLRQTQLAIARQEKQAAHLQSFIDRFRAKATKARQAQSRIKALERMEKLEPLRLEAGIRIRLPQPDHMPDPLLKLEQSHLGYGNRVVLRDINLMIRAGARIGVLGVNGAGKSTLIKTLADELTPLAGLRQASRGLQVGYFAQHQLDVLDPKESPLVQLARIAPDAREQELRNYLGGFGIVGDMATAPVGQMSGGEKARLALALIVWQRPNLLLLDEPSNHLDVDTREALTEALAEFEGSMLLVSHDRHLLRTTVDNFWIVADGGVTEFDGDLDDYREWVNTRGRTREAATSTPGTNTASTGADADTNPRESIDRKTERRLQAEARQRLAQLRRPLEKKLRQVEARLEELEKRKAELDAALTDTTLYEDNRRDERLRVLTEHGQVAQALHAIEEEWLALQEQLSELTMAS